MRRYLETMELHILPRQPIQPYRTQLPIPNYGWLIQPPHHHIHLVRKHLALTMVRTHRVQLILAIMHQKL